MNRVVLYRHVIVLLSFVFFVSCANYLKRRYFKGYHHVKASSQSDFILNNKYNYTLKKSEYDKPLYESSEVLITSTETGTNKNIISPIANGKNTCSESKSNKNNAYIKKFNNKEWIRYCKNKNKDEPEKNIEYYNKKFKKLLVLSIVMIILNILLYTLSYLLNPHPMGCGCIPMFFYGLFFFFAMFYFIKAIIYIIKFWKKEKPKFYYWFIILSIINLFLYFILLNGLITIFPFLGYLGFL